MKSIFKEVLEVSGGFLKVCHIYDGGGVNGILCAAYCLFDIGL